MSPCDWLVSWSAMSSSSIHAAAGGRSSFLIEAECYSLSWVDPTFIHSSAGGLPLPFDGVLVSLQTPARLVSSKVSPVLSSSPDSRSGAPSSLLAFGSCLRAFARASPPPSNASAVLPQIFEGLALLSTQVSFHWSSLHRGLISHEIDVPSLSCSPRPLFQASVIPGIVTFHSPVYLFSVAH